MTELSSLRQYLVRLSPATWSLAMTGRSLLGSFVTARASHITTTMLQDGQQPVGCRPNKQKGEAPPVIGCFCGLYIRVMWAHLTIVMHIIHEGVVSCIKLVLDQEHDL